LRHTVQAQGGQDPIVSAGDLVIDLPRHVVSRGGTEIKLTATEFKLLAFLVNNSGRVLTHQNILTNVWGPEYIGNVEYLRVFMSQLRKKLEDDPKHPKHLLSETGVGYRFSIEE
jgi:two-component system KDP operon response regulator KdpE